MDESPASSPAELFLPGLPVDLVRLALAKAGGKEVASGKFASPKSSAALAVNTFGWFIERPAMLPPFPGLGLDDWRPSRVDIERQMRFPWSGGRHPWLDAAVETNDVLLGIESKRFEPFRDTKQAVLSTAYDRDCWGDGMAPWLAMRDRLRREPWAFAHLDAAQLVKHAFGLVTEARRLGKTPWLTYLFAEPTAGRIIPPEAFARHRRELVDFSSAIAGAAVGFHSCSYRDWLSDFRGATKVHAARILDHFHP